MPTLFRLLTILAFICAAIFGAMWSLATFVRPTQSELTIRVPTDKINPAAPQAPAPQDVKP